MRKSTPFDPENKNEVLTGQILFGRGEKNCPHLLGPLLGRGANGVATARHKIGKL